MDEDAVWVEPWEDCDPPGCPADRLDCEEDELLPADDAVDDDEEDCEDEDEEDEEEEDEGDDEELELDELEGIDGIGMEVDCCVCIVWQADNMTATSTAKAPIRYRIGFMVVSILSRSVMIYIYIFYINAGGCDRLTVLQPGPETGGTYSVFCPSPQ